MAGFSVVRRGVADSHNSTADLAVLKEAAPNPLMGQWGAKGDNVTDDTTALQNFFNAGFGYGEISNPPGGAYRISSQLTLPHSMSLKVAPQATILATASMASMLATPTSTKGFGQVIEGGNWDANFLATAGIQLGWFQQVTLKGITTDHDLQYGLTVGPSASDGIWCEGCTFWVSSGTLRAGSVAINIPSTCTDNTFIHVTPMGHETGVALASGDNTLIDVHPWARQSVGVMKYGIVDNCVSAANRSIGCIVDTPSVYGWQLNMGGSGAHQIIGGIAYNNNVYGLDNTAVAVRVESGAVVYSLGLHVFGQDNTHRWNQDFVFAGSPTASMLLGTRAENVVNVSHTRIVGNTEINGSLFHTISNAADHGLSSFQQSPRHIFMTGNLSSNGTDGSSVTFPRPLWTAATPTYSASITPDASKGPWQTITVTNATAFTINGPTNPPTSTQNQQLTIEVFNNSGGAMGAITWNGVFAFAGFTWTNPTSTKRRFARFEWSGIQWVCTGVSNGDY